MGKSKLRQTIIYITIIFAYLFLIYLAPDIILITYVGFIILLLIIEWWTRVIKEEEDDYD